MKRIVISGAVLALAVGGAGVSQAEPAMYKVTGGGQIIVDTDEMPAAGGPGETIAFNARSVGATEAANGQLQYNSHDGVKFHGVVSCLVVEGPRATFAGVITKGDGEGEPFQVDVLDNGEGAGSDDAILLTTPDADDCSEPEDPTMQLGRGNVQVHKSK